MQYWALFLSEHTVFTIILVFIFGLIIGSFLNVVIDRLPIMLEKQWRSECHELCHPGQAPPPSHAFNLFTPRSRCPHCKTLIKALWNIPLISFLALRGRCGNCQERISWMYPTVELCFGFACVFALLAYNTNGTPNLATLSILLFSAFLLCLFVIDSRTQLLPDELTGPLLWLGLIFNLTGMHTSLVNAIIGAIAGYLVLWLIFWAYKLLTGKEGMGYGDFKLLAAIGAWLGWQALPFVLIIGCVATLFIVIFRAILLKKGLDEPVAFGPGLALGAYLVMMCGDRFIPFLQTIFH